MTSRLVFVLVGLMGAGVAWAGDDGKAAAAKKAVAYKKVAADQRKATLAGMTRALEQAEDALSAHNKKKVTGKEGKLEHAEKTRRLAARVREIRRDLAELKTADGFTPDIFFGGLKRGSMGEFPTGKNQWYSVLKIIDEDELIILAWKNREVRQAKDGSAEKDAKDGGVKRKSIERALLRLRGVDTSKVKANAPYKPVGPFEIVGTMDYKVKEGMTKKAHVAEQLRLPTLKKLKRGSRKP
ncbi:MAG: hypothetical protein GY842_16180 [bacterium]|nr:hypothetical protein [bacterium]